MLLIFHNSVFCHSCYFCTTLPILRNLENFNNLINYPERAYIRAAKTYTLQSLLLTDRLPDPCCLTHYSSKTAKSEVTEYVFHLRVTKQKQQRGEQAICYIRTATAITQPSIFLPLSNYTACKQ